MSDQSHSVEDMTAVVKIEKGVGNGNGGNGDGNAGFSQARSSSTGSTGSSSGGAGAGGGGAGAGGGGGGQESQPSPLALLAATCSRIESPNENSNNSQGSSQAAATGELDLTAASQLAQGANGWQIVAAGAGAAAPAKEPGAGDPSAKGRPVAGGQYVVAAGPGQQVLTGLPGVMPNIQYQVIPQFQTVDGQQLQLAATAAGAQVPSDGTGGHIQILPGANQQIITNRGSGGNIIAAMPNLLQQAVPLQGLANNVLTGQAQYVANVPVALNGNITLLPVNSVAASLAPGSQPAVALGGSGPQEGGPPPATSGAAAGSAAPPAAPPGSGPFFTNANSYPATAATASANAGGPGAAP